MVTGHYKNLGSQELWSPAKTTSRGTDSRKEKADEEHNDGHGARGEFRPKKAGSKRRKKGKMLYLSHKKRKKQKGEEEKRGKNKG